MQPAIEFRVQSGVAPCKAFAGRGVFQRERLPEYSGIGHNSCDLAHGEEELIPWLLAQRRRPGPERSDFAAV